MKLTGTLKDAGISLNGKAKITLEINEKNDILNGLDELDGKLSIELKKYREHRSLNANSYCWALIGKIADWVGTSKDEVYIEMLRRYGQSEIVSALEYIPFGDFVKYFDEVGTSVLNGKTFRHYRVYKGSSEFDSREMAILIDGIVSDAKELGVQTETPEAIAKMKSLWNQ